MDWILCLIAGALAGSLVSMTGSGAGFLLVPGLSLALSFSAFPNADLFKIAVATTHGANLITNLAAFQAHAVRQSIDWAAFIRLVPGSIAGAVAGAILATHLDTAILELVFIAFAVALSARLLRQHRTVDPGLSWDIGTGPGLPLQMLLELRPELLAVAVDPSDVAILTFAVGLPKIRGCFQLRRGEQFALRRYL